MSSVGAARFVGQSVTRVEDARILTGRGRYMDDIVLPGMLEGAFVRSDLGHARIASIDATRARSMPGVVAVITATELDGVVSPLRVEARDPQLPASRVPCARGRKVRYVGDPVAFVVAESRYLAEDARDAVEVDYEPLDAVVTMDQAADPARPALFEDVGSNVVLHRGDELRRARRGIRRGRPGRLGDDRLRAGHARPDGGPRWGGRLPPRDRRADLSRRLAGAARGAAGAGRACSGIRPTGCAWSSRTSAGRSGRRPGCAARTSSSAPPPRCSVVR